MRVRVLYFGVLKERFGAAEETLELAEGATVGGLVRVLRERSSNPAMASIWDSLAVAVNREYAGADAVLRDGDEVALLPPVSGGCCAQGGPLASLAVAVRTAVARAVLAAETLR